MNNVNYTVSIMIPDSRGVYNTYAYGFENEEDAEKFAYDEYQSLFRKYIELSKTDPKHYDEISSCHLAEEKQYYIDFKDTEINEEYFASIMISKLIKN